MSPQQPLSWSVVIPIKLLTEAKSRLAGLTLTLGQDAGALYDLGWAMNATAVITRS